MSTKGVPVVEKMQRPVEPVVEVQDWGKALASLQRFAPGQFPLLEAEFAAKAAQQPPRLKLS